MAEYPQLKIKRGSVKGAVTRILSYFDGAEEKTAAEARIRLAKLEECWTKFEEIQTQIEMRPAVDDDALAQQLLDGEAERQLFEQNYYRAVGKAQLIIDEELIVQRQQNLAIRQDAGQNEGQAPPLRQRPMGLPDLKLAEFNGDFTKWLFFKNSFETTIHQERDLSPMQKLQYLVGELSGEALNVIQGYTICNENYEHAWQLLKDTYDNKIIIIETHIDELLNCPAITKENKADSIRQFVWHIRTHMTSLQSLGQPVEQWETVLLHLAKKKLDFAEQRDWQNMIKDRSTANMPTIEEFLEFLLDRCNTLRVLNQGKAKSAKSGPQDKKKTEKKVVHANTTQECKYCKGAHTIYRCEELQKLSPTDRKKEILAKRLCINCLGGGHFAKDCKSTACKKCAGRHNTLLHRDTEPAASPSESTPSTSSQNDEGSVSIYCAHRPTSNVILSTARVNAYDRNGNPHVCRVLLDPGSQSNLMTESFAKKLQLPTGAEQRPISGINQEKTSARKVTEVRIGSIHEIFC